MVTRWQLKSLHSFGLAFALRANPAAFLKVSLVDRLACEMQQPVNVKFNEEIPKAKKKTLGRTDVSDTALEIHGRVKFRAGFKEHVREQMGKALGHNATLVERAQVWFDDINGPRGGVDKLCRATLVLSGLSNLHVEEEGADYAEALDRLIPKLSRALSRAADRRGKGTPKATRGRNGSKASTKEVAGEAVSLVVDPNLIGRGVGRAKKNLDAALKRPEKARGDALVDTAKPGVSASDRRAGGAHTARRNSKRSDAGMVATLEDSMTKPSRKSTRRSANGIKSASKLTVRETTRNSSPAARHSRAK